jgi:O-antigen/teichoic acid export membrane protein
MAPNDHHFSTDHLLANLKDRTISSAFVTTIAQGAQFALSLGSIMVLARLLTPHDFGLVAMVMTVTGFLRIFKDAGLSTATVQQAEITHGQVSNLFWINAALSGAMTLIVAACAPLIAWFYREPRLIGVTLLLSITFLLTGLTVQHLALLNRQMRFGRIALIQVGSVLLGSIVGIIMAWLKYGYWSLVGTQLAAAIGGLLLVWSISGWRPQLPARHSKVWPLLSFGANVSASNFLYSLARGSDSLLIGRFYGPESVGLYSRAAALLHAPLVQFLTPIESVFIPVLSRLQLQPERYRRSFLQMFEAIALLSFYFAGLLFVLAEPLTIAVLGSKWQRAAAIFAAFTFAALSYPLTTASTWLFLSQRRGGELLVANMWVAGLIFGSFLAGLPFGPVGVAVSYSLSSTFLVSSILFYTAGRRGPVSTADLWIGVLKHLPVWGVVFGAAWFARLLVANLRPVGQLCVCFPAGLGIGAAFIYIYGPSRKAFLSFFDALLKWRQLKRP